MHITMLGTGAAFVDPERAQSGIWSRWTMAATICSTAVPALRATWCGPMSVPPM